MTRRWTAAKESIFREQLVDLYIRRNLSIGEIAKLLGLGESTVFQRLQRLDIASTPQTKKGYLNGLKQVHLPSERSIELSEFFGIMFGDGHISHFQTVVTLGTKELPYVQYVADRMHHLFRVKASISVRSDGYRDVYIGSVILTKWLRKEGLVQNKVKAQVAAPIWIYERPEFMRSFLRGFFDTDGSIYRLRFGIQISLTNRSYPLLLSLRNMLFKLGYNPSEISADRIYLTRRPEVIRFFKEMLPANSKHVRRFEDLTRR